VSRLRAKVTPRLVVMVLAVLTIPALYGGMLIWSNQDPVHRLNQVPAAVVNEDQPVTRDDDEPLNLGTDLVDELLGNTDTNNFAWRQLTRAEASAALKDGTVLVVLEIPQSFSADVNSLGADDPADAATAELSLTTNDSANMIIGNVAATVGAQIHETLADKIRAEYLNQVYVGFTDLHDKISDAADGAGDLADGADAAADGSEELRVGLGALADGTLSLADGASSLNTGAHDLATGAGTLDDGLAQLRTQTKTLPAATSKLAAGADTAAAGAARLADGASAVSTAGTALEKGADKALDGATRLKAGLSDLGAGTGKLAGSADSLATAAATLGDNYDSLTDAQRKALIAQLAAGSRQLSGGLATAAQSTTTLEAGAGSLVGDASDGTGLAALASGASKLSDASTSLAKGAASLTDGLDDLSAGLTTLDGRTPALAAAVDKLADGADDLRDGATTLANGTRTVASATRKVADGASSALTGADSLTTGLGDLAGGADKLADGLSDGADAIPRYTDSEADHLSDTAAAPVTLTDTRLNEVPSYGYGLTGYFGGIALWVGAVAFYLAFDPLSKRRIAAGQPAWRVAGAAVVPGMLAGLVQGGLLAWVVYEWLGIAPAQTTGFVWVIALSSVAFFAINQALIALLGLPGRFLSLILLVAQVASAAGMYPVQTLPAFLQAAHQWLPLSYTVSALRSMVAGGTIGLDEVAPALLAWTLVAVAATWLAARMATPRHRRELASVSIGDQA